MYRLQTIDSTQINHFYFSWLLKGLEAEGWIPTTKPWFGPGADLIDITSTHEDMSISQSPHMNSEAPKVKN